MRIIELEQNTPEWMAFRLGKIGGSRVGTLYATRQYTVADVEKLLTGRGIDLAEFQKTLNETRKMAGQKSKKYTKADLETLLSEEDKESLSIDSEKRLEYYQILADQVAIAPEDDEIQYRGAMDRGHELEDEACQAAAKVLKKEVMVVGCLTTEEEERIYNSPDRLIKPRGVKDMADLIKKVNAGKVKITEEMEAKCLAASKHLMAYFERRIPEEYWTQKVQYFITNEHLKTLYWAFYNPRIPMLPLFILVVKREDVGHWPETLKKYQLRTLKELDALTARLIDESDNIILPARPEKGVGGNERDKIPSLV